MFHNSMSMQYVIKQTDTIQDVAINLYGRPEYAVKLIEENPDLISFVSFPAGTVIEYDAAFKTEMLQFFPLPSVPVNTEIPIYTIKTGQSAYDLAVMWGYGLQGVVEFMQDAGIDGFLDQDLTGQTFQLAKKQSNISNYITSKKINFATNATQDLTPAVEYYLLMQSGDFILLQNGGKIIL